MILHIVPKLFALPGAAEAVTLLDLTIEPFGLRLYGNVDLVTRHPFPNKSIAVACRKTGRKAFNGLLIQVPAVVDFAVTARWAIDAEFVSTHRVMHRLMDSDLDAVSDDMSLWCEHRRAGSHQVWSSRLPAWALDVSPCDAEPMMKVTAEKAIQPPPSDQYMGLANRIIRREQTFFVPTIESERLYTYTDDIPVPPRESAFVVQ